MKDFSLKIYTELVQTLRNEGYHFQTFFDFLERPLEKVVVFRHDVDLRNWAASRLAKLEHSLGVCSTYYFRMHRQSYSPKIIQQIVNMGHEIGYHYEVLSSANGDFEQAIASFQKNLAILRELAPIKTICMHGSSGSSFDNRDMWKKYNFTDFGIIGEPYLSVDYDKVLYLSDTGRRWNGFKVSVRDRVNTKYDYNFTTTQDIIDNVKKLPDQILITAHPEQWTDNLAEWLFVRLFALAHTVYKVYYRNPKARKAHKNEV